ncbi:MAG: hypothetical protein ACKVS9_09615 [Phycisphaerae bacterium]
MSPHPRIRTTLKWTGAIAAALMLTMWAASERWCVNRETTNWTFSLNRGSVIVIRYGGPSFRARPGWYMLRYDASPPIRVWWFNAWDTSGGTMVLPFNRVLVPLWMPTCVALLVAIAAWRLEARACRRAGAGRCPNCDYDRTGLAAGWVCPECGAASTKPWGFVRLELTDGWGYPCLRGGFPAAGRDAQHGQKYFVTLIAEERQALDQLVSSGKSAARKLTHARILLKSDCGPGGAGCDDGEVCQALDVSRRTGERVQQRFVEEGLEAALVRATPRREYVRKLDGKAEAGLIATACGPAPEGHCRWALRLLADQAAAESATAATARLIGRGGD